MPKKATVSDRLAALEKEVKGLSKLLKKNISEEKEIEKEELSEIDELKKLEELEKEIGAEVNVKPITKITYRDFTKSAVGAFFGVLGHFSFFYGVKISEHISVERATLLYLTALAVGALFLYFTGFRRVSRLHMIPIRLAIIYVTSLAIAFIVLLLFDYASFEHGFTSVYKTLASISILAVMGAAAADLLGKESE